MYKQYDSMHDITRVGGEGGSQVNVTMTLFWQELKI